MSERKTAKEAAKPPCKHEMICAHCGQDVSNGFEGHYTVICHKPGCIEPAPGLRELVYKTADQLEKWASESIEGAWSTHQVVPMRQYAEELRAALTVPVPK